MKKISEKILFEGDWLSLKEGTFLNRNKEVIKWEIVKRRYNGTILTMVAKLVPSGRYVLIKQFRPALDNYVIGFPAGISTNDPPEDALRELKEETGYIGNIVDRSPVLKANSGVMGDDFILFKVEIDEKDPRNVYPKQSLEPAEEIEVILKREEEIKGFLMEEIKKGCDVSSGLWHFFI